MLKFSLQWVSLKTGKPGLGMWVLAWYHVRSGMSKSLRVITAPHNRITEQDQSPDWRKWVLITISPSMNDRGAPRRSNTTPLASWNEIDEQNWRTSLLKRSDQPLLDNFGTINHYFLNFENKTCSRVALEFWKTRLASGMHTSRGLPKELILDLFKMARLYMMLFGYPRYTISNMNPFCK